MPIAVSSLFTLAGGNEANEFSRRSLLGKMLAWKVCFSDRRARGMLLHMKVREVLKLLQADGWYRVKASGGHRQFKHPQKPGRVTVSGKPNSDLPPGTLNSILKQAGLRRGGIS